MVPPCHECEWSGVECLKKTHGPSCKRCTGCKVRCSVVEEQRNRKETEIEKEKTIRVKRLRRVEGSENGEGEKIGVLKRIAEALEGMLAGQQELIEAVRELAEEQRGIRLGMEVWMRRDEERERKQENGKGKEKEKEVESDVEMDKSDEEKDGDGEKDGEEEEEENGKDNRDGGDKDKMDDKPMATSTL